LEQKLAGKLELKLLLFLISLGVLENCAIVVSNPNAGKAAAGLVASEERYLPEEITVEPLYSGGSEWNDYVIASDTTQACDGSPFSECVHAGEAKKVVLSGVSSCSGLTISESLNAFDWTCEIDGGVATFKAHSLKSGKGLSDLLNTSGFLNNSVTVNYAGESVSSSSGLWWSNQVIGLTAINTPSDMSTYGMTSFNLDLDSSIEVYKLNSSSSVGRIFVIGANLNIEGIRIQDDKTALVVLPGYAVTRKTGSDGNNCATATTTCLIDGESVKYSWLEGTFAAASAQYNVAYRYSYYNRFQNVILKDDNGSTSNIGMSWHDTFSNTINTLKILNAAQQGFYLYGSYNTLNDLRISNTLSNWYGLFVVSAHSNYFNGLRLINLGGHALQMNGSTSNVFVDTLISGVEGEGVLMSNSSSNVIMGLTSVNIAGNRNIEISNGDYNVLSNVVAANSVDTSIYVNNSNQTQLHNTLAWGANYAYYLINSDFVKAYGYLKNYATTPCSVAGITNGNIFDIGMGFCYIDNSAAGNAIPINPSNISFWGSVIVDSLNTHSSDLLNYGGYAYLSILDWFNFDSNYRTWAKGDGLSPPENPFSSNTRGRCSSGNCAVWDWRLKSTDTVLSFQNACPTGDEFLESLWYGSNTKYLRNAYEVSNDNIGNDNLLCESDETCVFMPHAGAFQGDGKIVNSTCAKTNSTSVVPNVTLKEYENLIY
jgi:hypothetical protein